MRRKEVMAKTVKQDCDARCFRAPVNASKHNKKAKRLSSKRLRRLTRELEA
jgi:hypothetical protein